jgi:hypothetical protein
MVTSISVQTGCCGTRVFNELVALAREARHRLLQVEKQMKRLHGCFTQAIPSSPLKPWVKYRGNGSMQGVYWGVRAGRDIRDPIRKQIKRFRHRGIHWFPRLSHQLICDYTIHIGKREIFDRFEEDRKRLAAQRNKVTRALVTARAVAVLYREDAPATAVPFLDYPFRGKDLALLKGIAGLAQEAARVETELIAATHEAASILYPCTVVPEIAHDRLSVLPYVRWTAPQDLAPGGSLYHDHPTPTRRFLRRLFVSDHYVILVLRYKARLLALKKRRDRIMKHIERFRAVLRVALHMQPPEDPARLVTLPPSPPPTWHSHPATPKQIAFFHRNDVTPPPGLTKIDAKRLMLKILRRRADQESERPGPSEPPPPADAAGAF